VLRSRCNFEVRRRIADTSYSSTVGTHSDSGDGEGQSAGVNDRVAPEKSAPPGSTGEKRGGDSLHSWRLLHFLINGEILATRYRQYGDGMELQQLAKNGTKRLKTSVHVCRRYGFSVKLKDLGLRGGATGLVTCPQCDLSGPVEILSQSDCHGPYVGVFAFSYSLQHQVDWSKGELR
jgi:hypothetical protein